MINRIKLTTLHLSLLLTTRIRIWALSKNIELVEGRFENKFSFFISLIFLINWIDKSYKIIVNGMVLIE